MAISTVTTKLVATANKQTAQSEQNYLDAFQRATRVAYSNGDMDECNFIIGQVPDRVRRVAVSFFKKFGVVVVENRGELPRAARVEDKSLQAKVFADMKKVESLGLTKTSDATDVAERAAKQEAKAKKFVEEQVFTDRMVAYLRTALKAAQGKNDDLAVAELSNLIADVKAAKA